VQSSHEAKDPPHIGLAPENTNPIESQTHP
jgi:hypothetical protein